MWEIVFRKNGVIIRSTSTMPIIGSTPVEVKIDYKELASRKLKVVINSVEKRENKDDWEVVISAESFEEFQKADSQKKEHEIEIEIRGESYLKYGVIPIPADYRDLFPGYKESFILETDVGEITTYITSDTRHTEIGDPKGGRYIKKGLNKWFEAHKNELRPGCKVIIEVVEPKKRYKLKLKR